MGLITVVFFVALVVGAPGEASPATGVNGDGSGNGLTESGAAYVFVRSGGVWVQQAYLKASNSGMLDGFGAAVAISGDTIVVGAPGEDSAATGVNGDELDNTEGSSGAVYVFVRSGNQWSQQAYLKASNTEDSDQFGLSVGISGETVVVGAEMEDGGAGGINGDDTDNNMSVAGAAYVFVRSKGKWSQQAYLKASNADFYDEFGCSVAISGDTAVVGARGEDSSADRPITEGSSLANDFQNAGAAYVFEAGTPVEGGLRWGTPAIVRDGNQAQLRVIGEPGTTYTLYRSGSLAPMTWQPLADMTAPASGAMLFTDPAAAEPEFFYRIGEAGAPPGP